MIRHCVLIKFKPDISESERQKLYAQIEALKEHLAGWQGFIAGANITPEIGMDKGYNGGFMIDFLDEKSHLAYLADTQHQQVGAQLIAAAEGGIEGIMVFDFKL